MMFISKLVSNIPFLIQFNMFSSLQYCKYRHFAGIATNEIEPPPHPFPQGL